MKDDVLQKAHLVYDLESERLMQILEKDETFSALLEKTQVMEKRLAANEPQAAESLAALRGLLLEMTRETCFKMGFLMANDYPLEKVFKL